MIEKELREIVLDVPLLMRVFGAVLPLLGTVAEPLARAMLPSLL